jgi:hypothetical protein
MDKKVNECRFGFVGVFLLGVLGICMTGKYYLKKEAIEDRQARHQRVAAEVERIKSHSSPFSEFRK